MTTSPAVGVPVDGCGHPGPGRPLSRRHRRQQRPGGSGGLVGLALRLGNALVAQSAERGAWSQLYAVPAPGVECRVIPVCSPSPS